MYNAIIYYISVLAPRPAQELCVDAFWRGVVVGGADPEDVRGDHLSNATCLTQAFFVNNETMYNDP